MKTMIALVGDQPLPNFLPARHYHPDNLILVYTSKTQTKYKYLKAVLQEECNVSGIETSPYDISAIADALNEKLDTLSSELLIFNLTGGTKTMSLAAHQVAQQRNAPIIYLQSEGIRSIIYLYNWQDHHLYRQSQDELQEYLNLREMLDLHLGRGKNEQGKDTWLENGPTIQSNGGHLFELAIAQVLRNQGYEVMCGVRNSNNNVDIDVMIRYQNQVGIIEAKTGRNAKNLEGVKQLSTTMQYLGGTYTKPFLVINDEAYHDQKIVCDWLHIKIISLIHYQKGASALVQEDADTLLSEIDKLMKGK
jgi:Domain of unknown function (DUF1887)/Restriction endonuclease